MNRITPAKSPLTIGFRLAIICGALTLAAGLTGCATNTSASRTIQIDSEPSGIRVEMNGEDLGRTPTTYSVQANRHGDFAGSWAESPLILFTAFPMEEGKGQYKQTKGFSPRAFMEKGDRVPAKIFST
jgi:hypothetical protein